MPDQLVAEYISTIYKYRGLLPFDNSESLSRREIANWSDEALAKYFVYVLRREQNICKKDKMSVSVSFNLGLICMLSGKNECTTLYRASVLCGFVSVCL